VLKTATEPMTWAATWVRTATQMKQRFDLDHRHQLTAINPWKRAAHSMVQAWRIRSSQKQLHRSSSRRTPQSWIEAARRMKVSLDSRAKDQAMQGSWEYWASHRPPVTSRYIRKSRRGSLIQNSARASSFAS
jgi:hypothetical protein